jgi:hypothetical protein
MEDINVDVRLALEEMRLNLQQSLQAGEALDQKLGQILLGSGAVLAVITALQLLFYPHRSLVFWLILIIAVGFYIVAILLALIGASPRAYRLPINPTWAELNKRIFNRLERDILLTLLSGYVDQIQHNRRNNRLKARIYNFSLIVLPITVVLLLILMAFH